MSRASAGPMYAFDAYTTCVSPCSDLNASVNARHRFRSVSSHSTYNGVPYSATRSAASHPPMASRPWPFTSAVSGKTWASWEKSIQVSFGGGVKA